MKTTPIYILLFVFFLNFELVWGLEKIDYLNENFNACFVVENKKDRYLVQPMYSVLKTNNEFFHSLNIALFLNSSQYLSSFGSKIFIPVHRLRLNIGLSKVLTELDYDFGFNLYIRKVGDIIPYITLGTNVYSVGYGGGVDINLPTKNNFIISLNLNYRSTEKLFGYTDAQQWYQSGFGAKLGITFAIH